MDPHSVETMEGDVVVRLVYIRKPISQAQKDAMKRYRQTENGKQKSREVTRRQYEKRRAAKMAAQAQALSLPQSPAMGASV